MPSHESDDHMKVRIQYEVLNDDGSAFGTAVSSGVCETKSEADAAIAAVLATRSANAEAAAAKHEEALADFDS